MPWRAAWDRSLYGSHGFYRRARPYDHFRTSVLASSLFAEAVVTLVRRRRLKAVTDLGSGDGELVTQLHALAPDLRLTAVELRPRPEHLPAQVEWRPTLPATLDGLLLANELLDNVACDVVAVDAAGVIRIVDVCAASGRERLGEPAVEEVLGWLRRWWPLERPGERAEVGLARDDFWANACARIGTGVGVAVDFGHLRADRPHQSTMRSYRGGHVTMLSLDGDHDITADVAVDSVAANVGGSVARQRDVL